MQRGAGIYTEQVRLGHLLPLFWSSMNLSCSLPPLGPRPSTLWGVRESVLHDCHPGTSAQWLSRMGSLLLPAGHGGLGGERAGHSVWLCQWFPLYPAGFWACDFAFRALWGPHLTPQWLPVAKRQGLCKWKLPSRVPQHRPPHALHSSSSSWLASLLSHPQPAVPFLTTPSGNLPETPD